MEFTGKVVSLAKDYMTGKYQITFSVNENYIIEHGIDAVKDILLDIKAVKHRKKRSLDANAYFHVLVGKLADALRTSKAECKNELICLYGQPELLDGEQLVYTTKAPPEYMNKQELLHTICSRVSYDENGEKLYTYNIYRGTHTYDSREMAILIDGTVSECKEQGIETIPPKDLEKMLKEWKPKQ